MKCRLCDDQNEDESEIHLIKCIKIRENIDQGFDLSKALYENIHSDDLEEQIFITKIFDLILKTRSRLLK